MISLFPGIGLLYLRSCGRHEGQLNGNSDAFTILDTQSASRWDRTSIAPQHARLRLSARQDILVVRRLRNCSQCYNTLQSSLFPVLMGGIHVDEVVSHKALLCIGVLQPCRGQCQQKQPELHMRRAGKRDV